MFDQIPEFGGKADAPPILSGSRSAGTAHLEAVTFRPSTVLWRTQLLIHLVMAVCLLLALSPLFFIESMWIALWLASQVLLLINFRHCYDIWRLPVRSLAFTERGWCLVDDCGEHQLELADKAVVWSWLIVLRYRNKTRPGGFNLVLLPDSATEQELRRLRVWMRTQI